MQRNPDQTQPKEDKTRTNFSTGLPLRLLLSALLFSQIAACQNKDKLADPAVKTAQAAAAPNAPAAPVTRVADSDTASDASGKLQEYISCYNQIDGGAHRTIARYASWVKDMNAGPSGNEKVVYGLYSMNSESIAKCKSVMEKVAKQQPSLTKLDSAAQSYANAISALDKAVADIYTYYDRENYKDDKFAKGKQLHVPLAASAKSFKAASESFSVELDHENDKLLDAELIQIEKTEGRKLPYLRMAMMNKAKKLMNIIEADTFAADAAAGKLADYEKNVDEAIDFAKKNAGSAPSSWSSLTDASEEFRKAAKERVRRIRDNVAYSDGEKMMLKPGSGWMVEGSQEKVGKAYNNLVTASNHLQ